MKKILNMIFSKSVLFILLFVVLASCDDLVEDGYRIDYPESDAVFTVEAMDYESGAAGNTVSYKLSVSSNQYIKSCVVQATNDGASGSGYDVGSDGFDDPFADHNYGTIKKEINSFVVKYDYIIPTDVNESKITFSVIDEKGKVSQEVSVNVVPEIKTYNSRELFARNDIFFDAFATIDGLVYPDIKNNYSQSSGEDIDVQEKIDIIYYYDISANASVISSVDDNKVGLELQVENATRFKRMTDITEEDFYAITPASLVELTQDDSIAYYGSSQVRNIVVGDIVGFTTDLIATHSLKTGLLKVKGLHPTNVEHYEGTAYVMECDIVTQIDQ